MRALHTDRLPRAIAAIAAAGVAAALVVAGSAGTASAGTTVDVRQGDFISSLSDTRAAGHWAFLKEGLHVWTDDHSTQAKAAEYFAVSGSLADMNGSNSVWYGTDTPPGQQIVFDADGTLGGDDVYNVLVGEPIYHGDWWATSGSWASKNNKCPETTGGSGSTCHGTLAEWAALLPDAAVYAGGFSLGSGIKGDGVLVSQTYGTTTYEFTSVAPATTSTMSVAPTTVVYGSAAIASGVLTTDGTGAAGQSVTLSRKAGSSWVKIGTATTTITGTWTATITPRSSTMLRATAAGFPVATAAVTVSLRVKAKVKKHRVKVKVNPNRGGHKVTLVKVTKKSVTKVGHARLDARSKATFHRVPTGRYLVIAKGTARHTSASSVLLKVKR